MNSADQKYSDKKLIIKGIKLLVIGMVFIVLTTYLITFTFLNKDVLPLYLLLPLSIISLLFTIYLLFKGIKTVVKGFFTN